jgi:hypothetical protein
MKYSSLWTSKKLIIVFEVSNKVFDITCGNYTFRHRRKHIEESAFEFDSYRVFRKDQLFTEWRRNGSETQFWKERELKALQMEVLHRSTCAEQTCDNDYANVDQPRPYVLRLVTNGMAAHNFGHAQHDVLWPFIIAHNVHNRFSRVNATIYVLEVGVFVMQMLRQAFPYRNFVSFRSVNDVPLSAEEVIISGLGMLNYSL